MTQLETDIGRFSLYAQQFNKYSPTTIIGALVLRLIESGTLTASDGSVIGGATTAKQDEIITLLTQLLDSTPAQTPLTPSLQIENTSGTIPAGAKFVSIGIRAGTGTILGTPVDTSIAVVEFPYVTMGYGEISYAIDSGGEFVIVMGR